MLLLTQFIFRLTFGLSLAMACTSPRRVSSGYYRNNLYVLLGLNVLASLVAGMGLQQPALPLWPSVIAAALSYVGAVLWLYEQPRPGIAALAGIAVAALFGAWLSTGAPESSAAAPSGSAALRWLAPVGGGLVLGVTMAAMLLGHWYLNAPGMSLVPLKRLVLAMGAALLLQASLCGLGLAADFSAEGPYDMQRWLFLSLRWLAGLAGAAVAAVMAWQTLKIPNTQSATGILYVGVIVTFVGELTSLLLSDESLFPL
jgi:hypothetical protein